MCTINDLRWASRNVSASLVKGKRILEVGSYDVNGSLRYLLSMLEPKEYTGSDIMAGPGVDLVCPAHSLMEHFGKESFDLVVSTSTLEHIREWKTALSNIKNVCKSGGYMIVTAPSRWPFHEYPYDFWRFGMKDFQEIFKDCKILKLDKDPQRMAQVYAVIHKPKGFKERDLSDYKLYSVITNKRVNSISDGDLKTIRFKRLLLQNKIWTFINVKGNRLLAYGNPCYPRKME